MSDVDPVVSRIEIGDYSVAVEQTPDGDLWIACHKDVPRPGKSFWHPPTSTTYRVYHPHAIALDDDPTGQDDHWQCPHCGDDWWVEHDG